MQAEKKQQCDPGGLWLKAAGCFSLLFMLIKHLQLIAGPTSLVVSGY